MKRKALARAALIGEKKWADLEKRRAKRPPKAERREWFRKWRERDPSAVLLRRCRQKTARTGIKCDLREKDLVVPTHCPVLGFKFDWDDFWKRPTVDRLNPKLGYTRGNVVVVSQRANQLRSNATLAELRAIIRFYKDLV